LTLDSSGEFDDSSITWDLIGTYDKDSDPALANANTCSGGSFNSNDPAEGDTRHVDISPAFSAPAEARTHTLFSPPHSAHVKMP
jgi:hypothetical protein